MDVVVIDHVPFSTIAVPIWVESANNLIVSPVTPVPVIVGLVLFVGGIVLMTGALGGVVSITRVCAVDAEDTFPA